ncbi:MAG: hypothetical protein J5840_03370 [Lachnospiraceae bacterium]|nr:hypothetical protein [Lachnospiraceae bacterium]
MLKRIFAIIGIILILGWIILTAVCAFVPFPGKEAVFPILVAGCIFLPLLLWLILWMLSFLTGKKNIASFETKTNDELFNEALKAQGAKTDAPADETDDSKSESESNK